MDRRSCRDIHVVKYFSSFISVSDGHVINVTDPVLKFCPLAGHLYEDLRGKCGAGKEDIKEALRKTIESKIKDHGFFTDKRKLSYRGISIPYGASEMLRAALDKKVINSAVVVCEGAGTVIVNIPDIVQGIGARMNSLVLTSPIKGIIRKLRRTGCRVISDNAYIDQVRGVREAVKAGYKTIAVTVSGDSADSLKILRRLEKENNVVIIKLVICTTGITKDKVALIRDHADLVWSCASLDVRRMIGPLARCQISTQIPVFVMTENGIDFIAAYADKSRTVKNLDLKKQYLFSNKPGEQSVRMGERKVFITEAVLPSGSKTMPVWQ